MIDGRDELLARVAMLYYYKDLSQQEIADQLAISRSNISRLLKEARERGIVEITIHQPIRRDYSLERQVCERFGLREAAIVEAVPGDDAATLRRASQIAAHLLESNLADAHILGISWGTTVHAIVDVFTPQRRYDVEVVQLMGGVASAEPAIDGTALVQRMAQSLGGRYRYLHAPLIVDAPEVAQGLLQQRNIVEALEAASNADVALVGIGVLNPHVSSLLRAGYLTPAEFDQIRAFGAVGDICARHFDADGKPTAPAIDARMIAVRLEQLAAVPTVIGVACTAAKAPAILAALRGGYLKILVSDSAAVEALLLADARERRTIRVLE
jgi:DNA-binding transcriptional regulator LsrR (DeoR family)